MTVRDWKTALKRCTTQFKDLLADHFNPMRLHRNAYCLFSAGETDIPSAISIFRYLGLAPDIAFGLSIHGGPTQQFLSLKNCQPRSGVSLLEAEAGHRASNRHRFLQSGNRTNKISKPSIVARYYFTCPWNLSCVEVPCAGAKARCVKS